MYVSKCVNYNCSVDKSFKCARHVFLATSSIPSSFINATKNIHNLIFQSLYVIENFPNQILVFKWPSCKMLMYAIFVACGLLPGAGLQ